MDRHLRIARLLTKLLDRQFSFFGFKFGLDPLLGLIPGFGDFISAMVSLYLVYVGIKMDIPMSARLTMIKNIGLDFFLGTLPVVGDVVDFFYRANSKNLEILNKHAQERNIVEAEIINENRM